MLASSRLMPLLLVTLERHHIAGCYFIGDEGVIEEFAWFGESVLTN